MLDSLTRSELLDLLPYLTEQERAEVDLLLADEPLTFREFIRKVNPRFRFYRHLDILIDVLQRVADGELHRLMVFMPPRHGKSETVSRLFSAYYVYRWPERFVGLSSYAAGLAYTLSRNARDNYVAADGHLSVEGVEQWETGKGGGMWAAGVGGPITGKGGYLLIVDDPLKNAEDAASETIREKQKEWWRSTFYTRAEPDAAIVVIMTRWHEDDLAGWLLSQETSVEDEEDESEHWHLVFMPAIAEPLPDLPISVTVEPDPRQPGEPLAPERYPVNRLRKIRRNVGAYFWSALYRQWPTSLEGGIFKRAWWKFWRPRNTQLPPVRIAGPDGEVIVCEVEILPIFTAQWQSWDMTFKDSAGTDFVVGQVWGLAGADRFLLDQVRGRMSFTATVEAVRNLSKQWPDTSTKLIEDKANGPAVISTLRRKIPGIIAEEPSGSKLARAQAVSPYIEAGNVYLPHPQIAPWVWDFIEECAAFPTGAHDDQVDAMSQFLRRAAGYRRRRKRSREY